MKIHGEVQGVFYRAQVCKIAKNLGLVGWVKNELDGSVKIVAEGEEDVLKNFIEKCYNIPNASVERIDTEWKEAKNEFSEFSIKI